MGLRFSLACSLGSAYIHIIMITLIIAFLSIVALLFFNIGIEVGQLLVVIVALGLVAVFGRLAGTKPSGVADSQVLTSIVRMPLYGAGTIAGYWFVERTLAIFI